MCVWCVLYRMNGETYHARKSGEPSSVPHEDQEKVTPLNLGFSGARIQRTDLLRKVSIVKPMPMRNVNMCDRDAIGVILHAK